MRRQWSAPSVLVLCLGCALVASSWALSDELLLKYDDDVKDGIQSYGGSGHVVKFEAPEDGTWYVDRVDVCASQYGGGFDPATTLCMAYVCDANMQALGQAQAPYRTWPHGQQQAWGSIDMPDVQVKGAFYVVVAPGSLANRGLYVAYDSTGKTADNIHAGAGNAGQAPRPPKEPWDWMIRAHLTTMGAGAGPEETGTTVLKWDDGSAEDKQSFAGSTGMVVRFEPPEGTWVVDAVGIFAGTYGAGEGANRTAFSLAICDEKMQPVGFAMYPYALFTSDMHWVKVDLLPDVPIQGPFHVLYIGNCMQTDGIYLGIDTSKGAGKSLLGQPGQLSDWNFRLPQNSVNWMIRVELKPG